MKWDKTFKWPQWSQCTGASSPNSKLLSLHWPSCSHMLESLHCPVYEEVQRPEPHWHTYAFFSLTFTGRCCLFPDQGPQKNNQSKIYLTIPYYPCYLLLLSRIQKVWNLKKKSVYLEHYFFLICGLGAFPSGIQGLLLSLCSGITPGGALGTIWGPKDFYIFTYKASTLLP